MWTEDQVNSLNEFQAAGYFHPFTCGNCRHNLQATKDGWICPKCDYRQDWCHSFMSDWSWKKTFEGFETLFSKQPVQKPPVGQNDTEEKEGNRPSSFTAEPPPQ